MAKEGEEIVEIESVSLFVAVACAGDSSISSCSMTSTGVGAVRNSWQINRIKRIAFPILVEEYIYSIISYNYIQHRKAILDE